MAQPLETLVYVARLRKAEKAAVAAHDVVFPTSDVFASLRDAVQDVCLDRLARAEGCLHLAQRLASHGADEEELRAAIGRAYYSIHHSLRAMALWQNQWDPDGHEESIKEFKTLLEDNSFRHRSGLAPDDWKRVVEARDNRHIADYSPYDIQREPPDTRSVYLTDSSWVGAAQFNIDLAGEVLDAALRAVG